MSEKSIQFKIVLKPGSLFELHKINGKKVEVKEPTYIPIVIGNIMREIQQLMAGKE